MTQTVHILSDGFHSPNARGFLHPLIIHRNLLKDNGIKINIFCRARPGFADCDLLIVDSKHFHGSIRGRLEYIQNKIQKFKIRCNKLAWYDSTDSAGWIAGEILPLVDKYIKSQILKDRNAYLKPMYGRRVYTDFYHRHNGISDDEPDLIPQVQDSQLLQRLVLGWNSGLANYTRYGPTLMSLYEHSRFPLLLRHSGPSGHIKAPRPHALSCRMGISYRRNTVSYQRKQLLEHLPQFVSSAKLKRGAYFAELRKSRATLSPFGLGEITLKDFEVFLAGSLLLKPDMTHIETWPNLYIDGRTIMSFAWNLKDIDLLIQSIEDNPIKASEIAARGQELYLRYVGPAESGKLFCKHFAEIVKCLTNNSDSRPTCTV